MLSYLIANVICVSLGTILQYILLCKTVPVHRPRLYTTVAVTVSMILWTINVYVFENVTALIDVIITIGTPLSASLFAKKGYRIKAVIAMSVYSGIQIMVMYVVALFAYPIAGQLGYSAMDLINVTSSYINAVMALVCFFFYLPVVCLGNLLLKKIFSNARFSVWLLCFLPIPISQAIIVNLLNRLIPPAGVVGGLPLSFTIASIFSVAADIGFLIGAAKVQQANQLKDQVRMAEEQMNIQTGYYRQLQEQILAINQIRHDLNNQLQAAYYLLEQGEKDQVRCQLDQLQDDLRNKVGPQFCANLMVDAVLADKARLCREKGIRLEINTNLPAELPIENVHLCSAFSNLLDNSIQGTLDSPAREKAIELRAALHSECLIISCSNPSALPVSKKKSNDVMRSHGLGLDILNRIAKEYSGTLDIKHEHGKFEAVLILKFQRA